VSQRNFHRVVLTCVAALSFFFLSESSVLSGGNSPIDEKSASLEEQPASVRPGDSAPDWQKLPGTDDELHSLSDLKDHDVIVICFTSNTCPYSTDYESRMNELQSMFDSQGRRAILVAVNSNDHPGDSLDRMRERVQQQDLKYLYLRDESQKVAKSFGAIYTPEFFVLNKERKVVYRGAMDDDTDAAKVQSEYVAIAVEAAMDGGQPEVAEAPARGCQIRYRKERRNSRRKSSGS
jgi:peroxiredoxin